VGISIPPLALLSGVGTTLPGKSCRTGSLTATLPSFGWKRTMSVNSFCTPPISSHGSQTLYEWPILDLL
jgi:hypothetical protein